MSEKHELNNIEAQFEQKGDQFMDIIEQIKSYRFSNPEITLEVAISGEEPPNHPLVKLVERAKSSIDEMLALARSETDYKKCEELLFAINIYQQAIIPMVNGIGDFPINIEEGRVVSSKEDIERAFLFNEYITLPISDIEAEIENNRRRIELLNSKPVLIYCLQASAVALFSTYILPKKQEGLKYEIENLEIGDGSRKRQKIRENIEGGKYSGIVVIDIESDTQATPSSLMNILAHTLQGQERKEFERKFRDNEVVFPPVASICKNLKDSQRSAAITIMGRDSNIADLGNIILSLQLGEYMMRESEVLSVEEMLPNLVAKMKIPATLKSVLVVDDNPSSVENIIKTLKAWPNLVVQFVHPRDLSNIEINHDIVLLDEDLGIPNLNGSKVYQELKQLQPSTSFISITSGNTPIWADNYFNRKEELTNMETATDFVTCINKSF